MNEKLNIQDLIDLLAEKHGMSKKNADSFVKEFFLLIEESLEKDKYVKIKGLGTFKLIDVESRESVNVNTGERFEIQGHAKVSFTPEPFLKDIINKPFAHFETVILNDNTVLEDTPLDSNDEDDEELEQTISETVADTKRQAADVTEEAPIVAEVEEKTRPKSEASDEEFIKFTEKTVVISSKEEEAASEETQEAAAEEKEKAAIQKEEAAAIEKEEETAVEKEAPIQAETAAEAPIQVIEVAEEAPVQAEEEKRQVTEITPEVPDVQQPEPIVREPEEASTMKYFIGIVIFVVLLCGGAVAFMYYPDLFDSSTPETVEEKLIGEKEETIDKMALTDSLSAKEAVQPVQRDTVSEALAAAPKQKSGTEERMAPVPQKEQKKAETAPFKPDSVEYTIAGTETTYTIKEGETLTRVALKFYGTKALWPYIVKHNPGVIKNPDNVPFGTTIKIPKLVKKQ